MGLNAAIARLRELNQPVPKPMRLPTPDELASAEQRLGIQFHADYRQFLLEASDVVYGTLEPATVTEPPRRVDLAENAQIAWQQMGVPEDLLPICEDNGDYYCMNRDGQVVFWSHDGATDEQWADVATWIQEVWIEGG